MSAGADLRRDAARGFQPWAALLFLTFLAEQLALTIALDPRAAFARTSWPSPICHVRQQEARG